MSGTVKGLTVEINGETKGLEAAMKDVGRAANDINKEIKEVEKGLKFDPQNTVLLGQKQELLRDKIGETAKGLDALRQAQERVEAMYKAGEIDKGQYRNFQRDLATTESKLKTFEKQVKDVDTAQDNAGKSAGTWGDKLKSMGGKGVLAGTAAAAAVGTALVGLGKNALESADQIQTLADKTGMSAEQVQELGFAATGVDTELETIVSAQAKLTKSMNAGRDGTGAQAEAFKALGISIVDSNGNLRDAKTVMFEAFDALNAMGNETERDATAMTIFGKSAMDLNPLIVAGSGALKDLIAKARESGAVMSNDAVAGLDGMSDGLEQLKLSVMSAIGQALSKLMPILMPILDFFLALPGPVKIIILAVAALAVGFAALTPILIAFTVVEWAALAPMLPIIATVALIVAAIGALIAIIVVCIKYHEQIAAALKAAWNAIADVFRVAWDAIKDAFWAGINFIKDTFWAGINWIKENWKTFLQVLLTLMLGPLGYIIGEFVKHWDAIKKGFWKVIDAVKDAWNTALDWLKSIPGKIADLFKDAGKWLFDAGKAVLQGLWDGMVAIWEKVWGWLSGIGSAVKNFFTGGAGTPNVPAGNTFVGYETPAIPRALGGVFSSPHLALIAEAGPEAVIPLSNPSRAGQVMQQAGLGGVVYNINSLQVVAPNPRAFMKELEREVGLNSRARGGR